MTGLGLVSRTHTPEPVDHCELLVQLHHEDDKEDYGEHHLTDGCGGVASWVRYSVADEDDETEDLRWDKGENNAWRPRKLHS